MDHSDLVAELPRIEKLTAAERLKIARDRRVNQILRHEQFDRECPIPTKKDKFLSRNNKRTIPNRGVHFVHSVILLEAAARNDIEEVRRLLMQGVCPDSQNEDGLTALHQCCIDDSESMMKLLLEFGANVNAEDSEKWTPLHAAATCGHLHLVKYLISQGAYMLAVNADGNMPYDICEDEPTLDYIESEMAREGVTQELIDETRASTEQRMLKDLRNLAAQGESLECEDSVGARPLHIAAANGYLSVVEFLLDQHVTTDSSDNDGWQPIHAAACWGHLEIVELLVQNGSDLNAQTKNHETPYDICEDPEMKARIAALRSEQESRARAGNQKTRRSQSTSTNTRTHSIRRNSTRDKGQISKRQIKNEAIFVIHQDDERRTNHQGSTEKIKSEDQAPKTKAADGDAHTTASFSSRLINSNKRHAPPPPPPSSTYNPDIGNNTSASCELMQPQFISSPILTTSAVNDSTIDIHVSVTINTKNPGLAGGNTRCAPPPPPLAAAHTTSMLSSSASSSSSSVLLPQLLPPVHPVLSSSPMPAVLYPVPSLSGGACTLADLKKQRSLFRVSSGGGVFDSVDSPHSNSTLRSVKSQNNAISNAFIFTPDAELNATTSPSSGNGSNGNSSASNTWSSTTKRDPIDDVNASFTTNASQAASLPKYQGETTELVGGKKNSSSSCCTLS